MEVWKEVNGYEGIYEVSSQGRIKSVKGKTTHSKKHGIRVWEERVLKQKTDRLGYKRVTLWKDKKPKDFLVHRLVAFAFLEKPEGKDLINHKDCNVANNFVENIEWCNHAENLLHAYIHGLNRSCKEIKLKNKQTGEIHTFISMAKASEFIGKNHGFISYRLKKDKTDFGDYCLVI